MEIDQYPEVIKKYIRNGCYHFLTSSSLRIDGSNLDEEITRMSNRKWRNLINEARADIPKDLWPFIDMEMPATWKEHFHQLTWYPFILNVPGLYPVAFIYRQYNFASSWTFGEYKVVNEQGNEIYSHSKYNDLSMVMAISYYLKNPSKMVVKLEELPTKNIRDRERIYYTYIDEDEYGHYFMG